MLVDTFGRAKPRGVIEDEEEDSRFRAPRKLGHLCRDSQLRGADAGCGKSGPDDWYSVLLSLQIGCSSMKGAAIFARCVFLDKAKRSDQSILRRRNAGGEVDRMAFPSGAAHQRPPTAHPNADEPRMDERMSALAGSNRGQVQDPEKFVGHDTWSRQAEHPWKRRPGSIGSPRITAFAQGARKPGGCGARTKGVRLVERHVPVHPSKYRAGAIEVVR